MRADYLKLRDRVLAGLATIPGLTCTVPEGAFYVYPNVSAYLGGRLFRGLLAEDRPCVQRIAGESRKRVEPQEEHLGGELAYGVAEQVDSQSLRG